MYYMYIELLKQIIQQSLIGYFFIMAVLFLYFLFLKEKGKKQTKEHKLLSFIFCYYLIGILTITGIGNPLGFFPRFEGIDFQNITSEIILNIVLFMPLGLFLPLMYENYNNIKKVFLTVFFMSLSVELFQMFGMGITSINDLITNTIGSCLGYFIFKLIRRRYKNIFFSEGISADLEILFYWVVCFIIMISIQPLVISCLFKLG